MVKHRLCNSDFLVQVQVEALNYYPDFYLPEYNVYLDPKNDYLINNKSKRFGITDVEKIEKVEQQNGIKIILLDKDNLTWENIKEKI